MKALVLENNEGLFVMEVKTFEKGKSLEFLQKEVGGYIERVSFIDELEQAGIDVWINEEGKLIGLPPTLGIYDGSTLIDIICGNMVFTRCDDEGNTVGLKDGDVELIKSII